jgi:hypothetical protein
LVAKATGLQNLRILSDFRPASELANQLGEAGFRRSAREVHCSIQRAESREAGFVGKLSFYLFDATSEYGSNLLRVAQVAFASLIIFFGLYLILAMIVPAASVRLKTANDQVVSLASQAQSFSTARGFAPRFHYALAIGLGCLYLSILEQSRYVGFSEISLRTWLLSLDPADREVCPCDYARTVAAVQNAVGLYLIVLLLASWIWTPFA